MKVLATIFFFIMIASCLTQKKVNSWLNDHLDKAAGYCADKFPPDTTTKVITDSVDTAAYEAALTQISTYADSLFMALKKQRESFKPTSSQPCPPPINLDSLRNAVDGEIRKRLIPCRDSLQKVEYTIRDRAREKQLQAELVEKENQYQEKLSEKDAVICARDKRITDLEAKVKVLLKWWWMFWILVAVVGLYTFLKLRFKLPI